MENDGKTEAWVDRLLWLEKNRSTLEPMRTDVRKWAETLDNYKIAPQYEALYANLLGSSGG